jgi:adenosylhomocysteine nucleosidase
MLAICAALSWEIRPVLRAIGAVRRSTNGPVRLWESTSRAEPIVVFRTGIGCEAASDATRQVLGSLPIRTVVNSGCAGALTGSLRAGSVVIPSTLLDLSNASREADEACAQRLREAAHRAGLASDGGPILTSPSVLATVTEKRAAHERFGATAVEMEGYAVANAAREHGSRFASARAILDSSELDLPTGVMSTNALKLALRAVASPHLVPRMVALANAVNAVQTSLERLFRCFLEETFSD